MLAFLPVELQEQIFIFASNPDLANVSKKFNSLAKPLKIRARWLHQKYGKEFALSHCWRWRFFGWNELSHIGHHHHGIGKWKDLGFCHCGTQPRAGIEAGGRSNDHQPPPLTLQNIRLHQISGCRVEQVQLQLLIFLIEMGAYVQAGDNRSLKIASRCQHLALVHFLLSNGADPNASVKYSSHWNNRFSKPSLGGNRSSIFPINDDDEETSETRTVVAHQQFGDLSNENSATNLLPPPIDLVGPPNVNAVKRGKKKSVDLLLQAVQENQLHLVELLVSTPPVNIPVRSSSMQQQQQQTIATLPILNQKISKETLENCLWEAIKTNKSEIARILIKEGGAKPTIEMMGILLQKAGTWRLGCGLRDKFSPLMVVLVHALDDESFDRLSNSIVRNCSEIGSADGIAACVERGADVNAWEGLALYSAVYSGNVEVVKYILFQVRSVNLLHFGLRQQFFCVVLMIIESLAIGMFFVLIAIWIVGLASISSSSSSSSNSATGLGTDSTTTTGPFGQYSSNFSVTELTCMAIPAALALTIMYRLVPFHRLCFAFHLVIREQAKRRRRQQEMAQV